MEIDNKYLIGIVTVILTLGGTVAYQVFDSGEEEVCRTGNGWEIVKEYDLYYEAVCPYTTKEPVYQNCISFRATSTKERYGCQVAILKEVTTTQSVTTTTIYKGTNIKDIIKQQQSQICTPDGCN